MRNGFCDLFSTRLWKPIENFVSSFDPAEQFSFDYHFALVKTWCQTSLNVLELWYNIKDTYVLNIYFDNFDKECFMLMFCWAAIEQHKSYEIVCCKVKVEL